jgi:hypothetical protein
LFRKPGSKFCLAFFLGKGSGKGSDARGVMAGGRIFNAEGRVLKIQELVVMCLGLHV